MLQDFDELYVEIAFNIFFCEILIKCFIFNGTKIVVVKRWYTSDDITISFRRYHK